MPTILNTTVLNTMNLSAIIDEAFQAAETAGTGSTGDGKPYSVDSVSPGTVTGTLAAKHVGTQAVTTSVAVTVQLVRRRRRVSACSTTWSAPTA